MRIFISYSHNEADKPLARYLARRLRAVGLDVWQDESSQPAGEKLQDDIEQAIRDSDHALFIVSKLWLASRWSKLEVDRFDKRDRTKVRRIPLFRLPRERLMLPMELIDLKGITWMPGEPHLDARFWEVYCAIMGRDPGPADEWPAEGAKLTHDAGDLEDDSTPARKSFGSLRCDRAPQWVSVTDVEPEASHDVLIVPGAAGQAHDHFSRRIREMLDPTPPRGIVAVHWDPRPSSHGEYAAALAQSLGVSPSGLARDMAERMTDTNLILIHQCLRAKFLDPVLISYYTEWLPALLQEVKPRMSLKCIQPVEWPAQHGGVGAVLTWLRLKPAASDEGKPEAETFIARIQAGLAAMRCIRLQDLADITDADIEEFCQKEQLSGTKKTWFVSRIKSRNPANSEAKLAAIDDFLADARSVS